MLTCRQCGADRRDGEPHVCGDPHDGYMPNVYLSDAERVCVRSAIRGEFRRLRQSYLPDLTREQSRHLLAVLHRLERMDGMTLTKPETKGEQ